MDLFPSDPTLQAIPIDDGLLSFMRRMPLPDGLTGDAVLARLIDEIDWRAEIVTVYGKQHPQPRLTAWYGVEGMVIRASACRRALLRRCCWR